MRPVLLYIAERFPLPQVALLALAYSSLIIGITATVSPLEPTGMLIFLVALSFVGVLLRTRVIDEFKDTAFDTKHYPGRPFQRGAVNARQLKALGAVASIVELGALLLISPFALLAYLLVVAYSLLTAKEFFVPHFLQRHFTLYFVSHQLIFVFFFLWSVVTFGGEISWQTFFGALSFVLLMAAFEILRKLEYRRDTKGRIVKDSYPAVWGVPLTMSLLSVMLLTSGLILTVLTGTLAHLFVSLISMLILSSSNFKIIQLVVAVSVIVQGALLFL